jgi:hypothetical protein
MDGIRKRAVRRNVGILIAKLLLAEMEEIGHRLSV